ncbi:hypothetical protein JOM56_011112 [Amanita muscaria]
MEDWTMADVVCPIFRSADFSEDAPQILVATQLRHAWRYDPTSSGSSSSVGTFMRENHGRTPEQRAALPVYPDKEAVHTPWRDEVYETWNHVFYDVMRFLREVNDAFGHFHPPKHDVFALSFPPSDGQETENTRVLTKTWDTDILLIPAHLEPGVVVRLETLSQREEDGEKKDVEKIRGRFSKDNAGEIWYLRKGVEARFFIEGEWDKSSKGLAAVMVHAILCDGKDCDGNQA